MDNLTLIHLVSEQTLQNLLPTLALRPSRVIQVRSSDPRFDKTPSYLETACRELGLMETEFLAPETIPSASPDIAGTSNFLATLCERQKGHCLCLNFTGGTKLMSIGAYRVAEHMRIPSLYTDTQHRRDFVDGGTEAFPSGIPSLKNFLGHLTVPVILASQGKAPQDWKADSAAPQELEFGRKAWDLRTRFGDDFRDTRFGEAIRNFVRTDNGNIPRGRDALQSLAQIDLTQSLAYPIPQSILDYLEAAVSAGYLRRSEKGSGFLLAAGPWQKDKLRSHIEKTTNLLVGSWLELSVLDFLTRSTSHHDIRWSVEATREGQPNAEYGETDIVSVHTASSSLEVISCKTALGGRHGPSPLEHLEGLRTRATNLGGNHARATLAVLNASNPADLRKWGRLLRVNVLIGEEIASHFQ